MKKNNKPVELTDEQLEEVDGGMKIVVTKSPKIISPILRLIFQIKKKTTNKPDPNKDAGGSVVSDDNME